MRAIADGRAPEGEPRERPRPAAPAEKRPRASQPLRPLSVDVLAASVRRAKAALAAGGGREAIELALGALVEGLERRVLASVYVLEHERLWMVSQRGYDEVRYGFSLDQGVMARAVRAGETQFVGDTKSDPDFIAEFAGITSEIAVPFPVGRSFGGVLNIETTGATLPRCGPMTSARSS